MHWNGWSIWRVDPGPCPVDDTPHTACTAESVALIGGRGGGVVTVPTVPPRVFSTASYPRPVGAPGAYPLPASVKVVRMRKTVSDMRQGERYYVRAHQADALVAQGVADLVVPLPATTTAAPPAPVRGHPHGAGDSPHPTPPPPVRDPRAPNAPRREPARDPDDDDDDPDDVDDIDEGGGRRPPVPRPPTKRGRR
jgi:hypothetical protein